jgi:putative endonuclease
MRDKKLYVGCTGNLLKRFEQHQSGLVESTRSRKPFDLIYYEACLDKRDAFRHERVLKTYRGRMALRRRLKSFFTGQATTGQYSNFNYKFEFWVRG